MTDEPVETAQTETAQNEAALLTTNRKALKINLDPQRYGTFAEIGAGQEVVRHFFQAGGAAGTVAKSISAYDMKFSDEIYGKTMRYVSRDRLEAMLNKEYRLLLERLWNTRGDRSTFFAYANTVAAKSYQRDGESHGWMGVRFQSKPCAEPNEISIHVRMLDKENVLQQQALGIIGVNLLYGAFYHQDDPSLLVRSLLDQLSRERIEVDMIHVAGPDFKEVNNRLLSLQLVSYGLTNAVMFGPNGQVLQPSEALHKKALLVERGSFRPVTRVNVDMLKCACAQMVQESAVRDKELVVLMEITMKNLLSSGQIDPEDFLARVDTLSALGNNVLVSNYSEYYRLASYFRRYTKEMIGMVMGVNHIVELFNEKYYEHLEGGILESFGRLFRNAVRLYVYPMRHDVYSRYLEGSLDLCLLPPSQHPFAAEVMITAKNLQVSPRLQNLYQHLLENHYIDTIVGYDASIANTYSRDEYRKIRESDPSWAAMVPPPVAKLIKERRLFGYVPPEDEPSPTPEDGETVLSP
ncbi:MAG TPA: TonB-dependent receptor [Chthoniobacteraceae bacterium]|nr:TonB-dependent receptor [Chthoniobacteraceae bacterium]